MVFLSRDMLIRVATVIQHHFVLCVSRLFYVQLFWGDFVVARVHPVSPRLPLLSWIVIAVGFISIKYHAYTLLQVRSIK